MRSISMLAFALCLLMGTPSPAEALDSRVRYRLRQIQRSLQYANKALKRGSTRRARTSLRGIKRKWKTMWRFYRDRISMQDPEIAQTHKQIQSLEQRIKAAQAAPAAPARPHPGPKGVPPGMPPARPHRGHTGSGHRVVRRRRARGRFYGIPFRRAPSAGGIKQCYNKQVMAACKAMKKKIYKTCRVDYASMYAAWHQRYNQIPKVKREVEQFMARHKGCLRFDRSVRYKPPGSSYTRTYARWKNACGVPSEASKCGEALRRGKKIWKKTVKRIAKSGKNKQLRFVLKHNKSPLLSEDVSAIRARLSSRVRGAARARARSKARFAARRCPKETYRNLGLRRSIRRLIYDLGGKHGRYRINVRSYQLHSAPTTPRYNRYYRYYTQTFRVSVCLKRKRSGRKRQCRIYWHRLKRVKPVGGSWGPWRLRSMIKVIDMPCAHMP